MSWVCGGPGCGLGADTGQRGQQPAPYRYGGNGHREKPAEGQQSLFSWAGFLTGEPAEKPGRNIVQALTPVPLRAGSGQRAGAGEGAGRRGALTGTWKGTATALNTMAAPACPCVRAFFVARNCRWPLLTRTVDLLRRLPVQGGDGGGRIRREVPVGCGRC